MLAVQGSAFRAGTNEPGPAKPRVAQQGSKLAVGLAPQVDQAVAIQISGTDPARPMARFSSRPVRSLQDMPRSRIEVRVSPNMPCSRDPDHPGGPPAAASRPAHGPTSGAPRYRSTCSPGGPRARTRADDHPGPKTHRRTRGSGSFRRSLLDAGGSRHRTARQQSARASAVADEVGRVDHTLRAVLGLRLETHATDPAGLARAPSDTRTPPKFGLRRRWARVRHDDLGPAVDSQGHSREPPFSCGSGYDRDVVVIVDVSDQGVPPSTKTSLRLRFRRHSYEIECGSCGRDAPRAPSSSRGSSSSCRAVPGCWLCGCAQRAAA